MGNDNKIQKKSNVLNQIKESNKVNEQLAINIASQLQKKPGKTSNTSNNNNNKRIDIDQEYGTYYTSKISEEEIEQDTKKIAARENEIEDDKTVIVGTGGVIDIIYSQCTIKILFTTSESVYKSCILKLKDIFYNL